MICALDIAEARDDTSMQRPANTSGKVGQRSRERYTAKDRCWREREVDREAFQE
jgi:hypothetical protein